MSFLRGRKILLFVAVIVLIFISGFKFLNYKYIIGFQHPESVCMYKNYMFVSNIGSSAASQNRDGFITKLDEYGNILEYKYIYGLKSPKGIFAYDNMLYIADLDRVCEFNLETQKQLCINIKGSKFLNDIVYANGSIYVTDTMNDAVYKIDKNNKVELFFSKKGLSPNGIAFLKKTGNFAVVSFDKPSVNIISPNGILLKSSFIKGYNGFDGVCVLNDSVFVSDYKTGAVLSLDFYLKKHQLIKRFNTPVADFFIDKNKLIAPLIDADKLYIGYFK